VHGTLDAVIPVEDAKRWDGLIKNHQLALIEDADHNFLRPEHASEMVHAVVKHCCH
jgi:dipeptidyl aminopeptidase/acylaminoacyl peptidase